MIRIFVYDLQAKSLAVTFVSGRVYVYQDVPAEVAEGLRLAFAKGEYFNKAIRHRYCAVESGTACAQRSLL